MKFVFNILLISAFVALGHAACEVCTCDSSPEFFPEDLLPRLEQDEYNRTFITPKGVRIENCGLVLECDFEQQSDDSTAENYVAYWPYLDPSGDGKILLSQSSNLNEVTCVGGKWEGPTGTVENVGCYTAVLKIPDA